MVFPFFFDRAGADSVGFLSDAKSMELNHSMKNLQL